MGFLEHSSPRGGELVAQLLPQVRATIFSAHGVAPEKCHWLVLGTGYCCGLGAGVASCFGAVSKIYWRSQVG